jgi:hypothetical protein
VKALKESGHAAARARRLVLIGDNFAENKSNEDFAFASELVARGWYDQVELYYGPVGHTHNGVDAQHKIHNQNAMNYTLGTPADLANAFRDAWHNPSTRPDFAIMEYQLDWKTRYKNITAVKGFTRTKNNPMAVHAFKFARRPGGGTVEMMFKEAPSRLKPWLGADHQPRTAGFRVLRNIPNGAPNEVPAKACFTQNRIKGLTHSRIVEQLAAEGMDTTAKWLEQVIEKNGALPFKPHGNGRTPGEMGELVTIGAAGHEAVVRRIIAPADM